MKKKNKIYKDYSKITNATKGNKNIILIAKRTFTDNFIQASLLPKEN